MRFGAVPCLATWYCSLSAAAAGCIDSGNEKNVLIVGNHLMSDARELKSGYRYWNTVHREKKIIVTETLV